MKLDFLSDTPLIGPTVRLYAARSAHVLGLAGAIADLADETGQELEVHRLPEVESVAGCELTFKSVLKRPHSVITRLTRDSPSFIAQATCEDWITVKDLLDPFLKEYQGSSTSQWLFGGDARGLISASNIALLLTSDAKGTW